MALARQIGGEIVNCDSLQVYRGMDIGTAKTPVAERGGIPHHLLDLLAPDQVFNAGDYAALARPLLRQIAERGSVPLVVGGTGFYLRALLDGLAEGPKRDDALRQDLARREERRQGALHRILQRLDGAVACLLYTSQWTRMPWRLSALQCAATPGPPPPALRQTWRAFGSRSGRAARRVAG